MIFGVLKEVGGPEEGEDSEATAGVAIPGGPKGEGPIR